MKVSNFFKKYYQNPNFFSIKYVNSLDALGLLNDLQFFFDVKIKIGFPYTSFNFPRSSFVLGFSAFIIKFYSGFNNTKQLNFFLNGFEITENLENALYGETFFDNFLSNILPIIQNENEIIVEILDYKKLEYHKNLLLFSENIDGTSTCNYFLKINKNNNF